MSEVKRYAYGFHDDGYGGGRTLGLIEREDGELVTFADFDATEAARVKAEAECERLNRQVKHWKDLAVANRKVADEALAEIAASDQALRESRANDLTTMATLADVRAELSALKAQQAGQEPVLWARQCDLDESDPALFVSCEKVEESGYTVPFYPHPTNSVEGEPVAYTTSGMLAIAKELPLTGRIGARCKADERWNVPLYTAPQPAPAQDVAGLVRRLNACEPHLTEKVHYTCDEYGDYRTYKLELYIPTPAKAVEPFAVAAERWIRDALAAHDKQSGGK